MTPAVLFSALALLHGTVTHVSDGDTLHVRTTRDVTVRVLGIDTPELPHFGKPGTCYGTVARAFVVSWLPLGTPVAVRTEPSSGDVLDHYGRTLGYVYGHHADLGAALLRRGLANVYAYRNRHFVRRASYERLRDAAKAARRGLWGACPASEWPR